MLEPDPVPRPHLFLQMDTDDWNEQYRVLAYVAKLTPMQIAQIDYGLDPEHPEASAAGFWARRIERQYPVIDWRNRERSAPHD